MNEVIGQLAPVALGVAISPVPVIAVILVLMGPRARGSGPAFLLGWVLGVGAAVTLLTVVGSAVDGGEAGGSRPVLGTVKILAGLGLVALAVRQWRARPAPGEESALPGWMSRAGEMGPGRAGVVAAALAALNPKNLLLCASGGAIIAGARPDVSDGGVAVAVAVFTVVASLTVLAPVGAFLLAPVAAGRRLESVRRWLSVNNTAVMAVMLLVLGTVVLGQGVAEL